MATSEMYVRWREHEARLLAALQVDETPHTTLDAWFAEKRKDKERDDEEKAMRDEAKATAEASEREEEWGSGTPEEWQWYYGAMNAQYVIEVQQWYHEKQRARTEFMAWLNKRNNVKADMVARLQRQQ